MVDGENEVEFSYNDQDFTETVTYDAPETVSSVDAINETVDVAYNTAAADVKTKLDNNYAEVQVTLSDDSTATVPVTWDVSTFEPKTEGEQTVEGSVDVSGLEDVAETTKTTSVTVKVLEDPAKYESASDEAATTVVENENADVNLSSLTSDINLPKSMEFGDDLYTAKWDSSHPEYVKADGTFVKQPAPGEGDVEVTLTATLEWAAKTNAVEGPDKTVVVTVTVPEKVYGDSLTAENGSLTVTLTKEVADAKMADFTVEKTIDSGDAVEVTPTNISIDGADVTLTVPTVEKGADAKEVSYSVAYNDTEAVSAGFTVEAATPVVTTIEVSDVSVEENKSVELPTATVKDQFGRTMDSETVTFSVENDVVSITDGEIVAGAYAADANTATLTATSDTDSSVTGTATVTVTEDTTAPTIESVVNKNGNQLEVTFSEKVTKANAETAENYALRNTVSGDQVTLDSDSIFVLGSDKKTLTITLDETKVINDPNGIGLNDMGTLDDVQYRLFVNRSNATEATLVDDLAENKMSSNSYLDFQGKIEADEEAPSIVDASYNTGTYELTINFNEKVKLAANDVDETLLKVSGDSNSVTLADGDYPGKANATSVTFKVQTAATKSSLDALSGDLTLEVSAGAFKDTEDNSIEATNTDLTVTKIPVLQSASYDESTNEAVFVFSKKIDVSEITTFDNKFSIAGTDIDNDTAGSATFNTSSDIKQLSFTLTDAAAQSLETAANGAGTTFDAAVVASTVQDLDGNANVADSSSYEMTVGTDYIKDETAPTLDSATYKADTQILELNFNESIIADVSSFTLADVEIYEDDDGTTGLDTDNDTKLGDFSDFDANASNDDKALTNSDLLDGTGTDTEVTHTNEMSTLYVDASNGTDTLHSVLNGASGDVYIVAKADSVTDPSSNKIASKTSVKTDMVNVSNTSAVTSATTITVTNSGVFDVEFKNGSGAVAMDSNSATNPNNYDVHRKDNTLNKIDVKSVKMNSDNTVATLFLDEPMTESGSAEYEVTTSNLKTSEDENGNLPSAEEVDQGNDGDTTTLTAAQSLALTDEDESGTVSSGDKIELTFNEPVKLPADFAISDLSVNNSHTLGNSTFELGDDQKTFTITAGSSATIEVGDKITFPTTITDYEGNALDGANDQTNGMTVSGDTAPVIQSTVYADANSDGVIGEDDTLTITMDQKVYVKDGKTTSDLNNEIDINGNNDRVKSVSINDKVLTVTLNSNANATDLEAANVKINGGEGDLVNVWGTAASDTTGKSLEYADQTAPKVVGFEYDSVNNKLIVEFDEAVDIEGADGTDSTPDAIADMIYDKLSANNGNLGSGATAAALVTNSSNKKVEIDLDGTEAIDQFTTISVTAGEFDAQGGTDEDDITEKVLDASNNPAVRDQGTAYEITIQ